MNKVGRALISVYDKTGIVEFAQGLRDLGIEVISTGGTAQALKEVGIPVINIADVTGYPEMLDGRVKTLHPKIHGGILARRDSKEHVKQLSEHDIKPIDIVVVNLYPFSETIAKPEATLEDAIEQIDIGGVALIRSSAKNFKDVAVVVNPARYTMILEELQKSDRILSEQLKMRLAVEAFKYTSSYDTIIHEYLKKLVMPATVDFPNEITLNYTKVMDLRYGENPHQKAAFYREIMAKGVSKGEPRINLAKQLHGKELSFNNLLDLEGALGLLKEFMMPAAVIVKHTNPCGAAVSEKLLDAYLKALATDPVSSFGGIVALNGKVDEELANELNKLFIEVLVAPEFTNSALSILKQKTNVRIMQLPELTAWVKSGKHDWRPEKDMKKILGGILLQDRDTLGWPDKNNIRVVTQRMPADDELKSLEFAWKIVKHVKSNAIVFASGTETAAIGAGQMSRVDSVRIAVSKAQKSLEGCVLASDAFFPFKDAVEEAIKVGVKAIVQPGGSKRDEEVIEEANKHNVAMIFTGERHFKH